ncbi:hypothetical protein LJB97_04290 [Parabacteroides sp. OttesenSCG-928-O15]|nr:hypothetical protein [Parabacteroides sp. OttesenSCG-928-O15]
MSNKNKRESISRRAFINRAALGTAAIAMAPVSSLWGNTAAASFPPGKIKLPDSEEGMRLLKELTALNDGFLAPMIQNIDRMNMTGFRNVGGLIMAMSAAYVNPESKYNHDNSLPPAMEKLAAGLAKIQNPSGLFNGGNMDSPPDTGFLVKTLCKGQHLLLQDNSPATANLRDRLKELILKISKGLLVGGVHTPNHRWDICSALAHINSLYPDKAFVERIDDWLDEGIDIDEDGQWGERSSNYNSAVNNPAMMNLALSLKRDWLLEPLRRNLEMTIYYVGADGMMETVASRRQDQRRGSRKSVYEYYSQYRLLAVIDNNGVFASMARYIEENFMKELAGMVTDMNSPLVYLLEEPLFGAKLPELKPLPENYVKLFPNSRVVRYRRGDLTATINGGNDASLGFGFASGLAMNPAFFRVMKGKAVLDSIRMTPAFFNTGFFYPNEFIPVEGGYMLRETRKVPYHLPLPEEYRNEDGQYKLTPDGRFYSKMDFPHRPKDYKTIVNTVTIREKNGAFTLDFDISGYENVPVTIELCFRRGGKLEGVELTGSGNAVGGVAAGRAGRQMLDDPESYKMNSNWGSYTVEGNKLEFGPGVFEHTQLGMEGEQFSIYNGELKADGLRVYITGNTPFKHTLQIK